MRIQICMHWNFFNRTNHYKDIEPLSHTLMKRRHFNEKGEEPQSLSIDLAKIDFARSKVTIRNMLSDIQMTKYCMYKLSQI